MQISVSAESLPSKKVGQKPEKNRMDKKQHKKKKMK
jgi:hypothetical protein